MAPRAFTILFALGALNAVASLSVHSASSEDSKSCSCLNWKQTYAKNPRSCGMANEFFFVTQGKPQNGFQLAGLKSALGGEFCERFYETIDDNYCVNVNMGTDNGQWCFVDSKCHSLNGGERMATHSWKKCHAKGDKMLREYEPEQLASLAKSAKLDIGLLHKMSYPLHKKLQWKDVSSFWGVPVKALTVVPDGLPKGSTLKGLHEFLAPKWGAPKLSHSQKREMQTIMDSGLPYSFDTDDDQHPPHVIVQGKKVYLVLGGLVCLAGC